MQAIVTKFPPCTDHRESRVKATCEAGSLTLGWDHALNVEENHRAAAKALQVKLGWTGGHYGRLAGGGMPGAGYCWVMVPDVAASVLEWARTPGDHGGNPHCKEFVRLAERFEAAHP